MSLKSRFNINSEAANVGVWINYPEFANKDKTVPGFLVAHMSQHNKRYMKAFNSAQTALLSEADRDKQFDTLPKEQQESILRAIFLNAVLLNWRNFEPNADGKKKKHSKKAADVIFAGGEWDDLYADVSSKATENSRFNAKAMEKSAKNS